MRSKMLAAALLWMSAAPGATAAASAKPDQAPGRGEVTVYGTVDVGLAHQSHGVALDGDYPQGLEYLVSKNSGRSVTTLAPNGLSQSKLGVKGRAPITADLSVLFQADTGFSPLSGRLADGLKTLVKQNGQPLTEQAANGDSSRAGQLLQGVAFFGLASKSAGTLTFGRHNSLMLDAIVAYDPQAAAYAFSPIGYSGVAGGMGATEAARLDQTVKYRYARGPYRLTALYKLGGSPAAARHAYALDLGGEHRGLSVDLIYGRLEGAVAASSLSAGQLAAGAPAASLAATISDNTVYGVVARRTSGALKLYGGWERIEFRNPKAAFSTGDRTLGGYVISVANTSAYAHRKVLDIVWLGARYALTPRLEAAVGQYLYVQNSFRGDGCADARSPACSGKLTATSISLDYKLNKRLDAYAGAMASRVTGGLASGYLNRSSLGPMLGVRYSF